MAETTDMMKVPTGNNAPPGMVDVTAPSDLKEGYQLQVSVNGETTTVTVPVGGVKEGQIFRAQRSDDVHFIPRGRWRDGLCDCCKFGICHAMCCLGYWCQPILTGQVMTRMSRDWLGGPGPRPAVSKTCQIVTGIFILQIIIQGIIRIVMDAQSCAGGRERYNFDTNESEIICPDGSTQTPTITFQIVGMVSGFIGAFFALYWLVIMCRTRDAMRKKYDIDAGACGGCEDCCCVFWCSCCAIQQMARHTNDYEKYDVKCCSGDCFNGRGQQECVPEIEP